MLNNMPGSQFIGGIYNSRLRAQVTRLTRAKQPNSFGGNIDGCVCVAVVSSATFRASPRSDVESQFIQFVLAVATGFAGRVELVNRDQGSAVPLALVFQLPADFSPASIRNRAGKPGVLNHILHIQIFDANNIEFSDEPSSQLVCCVLALLFNLGVGLGYAEPLAFAAHAVKLTSCKVALLLPEIAEPVSKLSRALNLSAIGQGGQMFKAEIDANSLPCDWKRRDIRLDAKTYIVIAIRFTPDCGHAWPIQSRKIFSKLDAPELWQRKDAVTPAYSDVLKPKGVIRPALSEFWVPMPLACLNSAKEGDKGFVLVSQYLGNTRGRRITQPRKRIQLLKPRDSLVNFQTGDSLLASIVSLFSGLKRIVPNPSRAPEPMIEHANLRPVRVAADFVGTNNSRHMPYFTGYSEVKP